MKRVDKLVVALRAIEVLPKLVRQSGTYTPVMPRCPAHWRLETGDWCVLLTERVLLHPDDPALSCLIDVFPRQGVKVFSTSWMPDRPWLPPRIVRYKAGAWEDLLDRPRG